MSEQQEVKRLIGEINRGFEEFRTQNNQRLAEVEKRGEATAETRETVDRINADITDLKKTLTDLEARMNRPNFSPDGGGTADDPRAEVRTRAFDKYVRYGFGESGRSVLADDEISEIRALSDGDGGFMVPPEFDSQITMAAYDQAEIRPITNVAPTGRDTVQIPSLKKPTVAWGRANVAVSTQTLATGGDRLEIQDVKALILIPNNTLDDSEADVLGEVVAAMGPAIAEAEDDEFAIGNGVDSPLGVLMSTDVQANFTASGVAAALSDASHNGVDALIGCLYTPKKTYRRNGYWAMNSSTEATVRKLKDSDGQYLWQPSVQAGKPATLLGYPIINPEGLPDIAAGAFPIIFGDWKAGYRIRDRRGITVQRLVERYAEYDQTGLLVKKRTGGMVVLAEAFACVKIAA